MGGAKDLARSRSRGAGARGGRRSRLAGALESFLVRKGTHGVSINGATSNFIFVDLDFWG